jgi:hypothetical protein
MKTKEIPFLNGRQTAPINNRVRDGINRETRDFVVCRAGESISSNLLCFGLFTRTGAQGLYSVFWISFFAIVCHFVCAWSNWDFFKI